MSSGIVDLIKKVALAAINEHALQLMLGKVVTSNPLVVKIGDKLTLTAEHLVLDTPVDDGEEVIVFKYSSGEKYLVLSTIQKVYKSSVSSGGVLGAVYSTLGEWKSLGTFTITHYCCEKYPHICNAGPPYKTATGTTPHVGGCAVDPKKIPLGSYVKINGVVYHAEDTGGAIDGNRIDIVVGTHEEALNKGTYRAEVFIKVGD